ncbi:MAG: MATE family efflux transporter [Clostridiales bacterium]|nr:MATE family efflux transporter [Clostridiales bacterium]
MKKENKMGVMPINKLLISMALPMMISMLVQALYNVVDSMFVAKLSENALTAVSLAFPMQNLMISTAVGIGVGINALLSRSLGQRDYEKADKTAVNGVFIELIAFFIFLILSFTVIRPFYITQSGEGEITELGVQYLSIVTGCSLGLFVQIGFERVLQATGRTVYTMITQGTGAVINIILDPIMIFGLLGFPKLGVAGAAVATVIGQIVAGIIAVIINHKKNPDVTFKIRGFRPDGGVIRTILSVGIPSMLMASVSSVMTFCLNKILIVFSSTAVAVFGVYFKLQSFIFMPVFGLNNGMVPIVSFNYGARERHRIMQTVKYSLCYAFGIMFLGFLVMQIFPQGLFMLFNASADMLSIGVPALRIISISFLLAGGCVVIISVFQALGKGVLSMLVSFTRQIIVLVPVAYVLSRFHNIDLVWWSFPIAELASITLTLILFRHIYHKLIKPLC